MTRLINDSPKYGIVQLKCFQSKSVLFKEKHLFLPHILHVLLFVLCRLISSRLRVLEADGVVQIIPGVVGYRVVVRVGVEGDFLLNRSRGCWLLHRFLLFLLHRRRRWRWWDHHLPLHRPWWVVNQAVGVPVGITVVLHALEGADGGRGRLLDEDRWRWGGLLWWRGRRLGHCNWGWWGLLGGAVGVVAGVAEDRHGTGRQVDDVGLAEGVLFVAQVEHISLGDAWSKRERRRGRLGLCGLWDTFHGGWRRSDFAFLVCGRVAHDHRHSQFALEVRSVGAIGVLQVPHLLVEHPQLVNLIQLRGRKHEKQLETLNSLICKNTTEYQSTKAFNKDKSVKNVHVISRSHTSVFNCEFESVKPETHYMKKTDCIPSLTIEALHQCSQPFWLVTG